MIPIFSVVVGGLSAILTYRKSEDRKMFNSAVEGVKGACFGLLLDLIMANAWENYRIATSV